MPGLDAHYNAHLFLPPCKDMCQHIAKGFKSCLFDTFALFLFWQVIESFNIRAPLEFHVVQRALFRNGHSRSPENIVALSGESLRRAQSKCDSILVLYSHAIFISYRFYPNEVRRKHLC
jgi:hypothetical protein